MKPTTMISKTGHLAMSHTVTAVSTGTDSARRPARPAHR